MKHTSVWHCVRLCHVVCKFMRVLARARADGVPHHGDQRGVRLFRAHDGPGSRTLAAHTSISAPSYSQLSTLDDHVLSTHVTTFLLFSAVFSFSLHCTALLSFPFVSSFRLSRITLVNRVPEHFNDLHVTPPWLPLQPSPLPFSFTL